jgi:hypothetical protein
LLEDHACDKYFAHIDIDQIRGEYKDVLRDDVKGLDDLLITFPNQIEDIIADLNSVSKARILVSKIQHHASTVLRVRKHFHIDS